MTLAAFGVKTFVTVNGKKRELHMPLQSEEKKPTFKCNQCSKTCKTSAALSVHTKCIHGNAGSSSSGKSIPAVSVDLTPGGSNVSDDVMITNHIIDHVRLECRDVLDGIITKVEGRVAKSEGAKKIAGNIYTSCLIYRFNSLS